ncbi:MAG: hypothetical protein QOG20_6017 [Pseudonocardiales bacterium]|jgi:uncharacterized membrane protein HdeD (DUF308 family)|nr:hypothetical protein [Pseudonocardiales bacterium]
MDAKHTTPATDDPVTDPLAAGVNALRTTLVLRAVLAVAIGVVALLLPGLTLLALALAFGIYAILDGVARGVDAVRHRGRSRWWLGLVSGLVGVAAGIIALIWPGLTAVILATLVGVWAIVIGVGEVVATIRLRRAGGTIWLMGLAGVLSVIAGILILIRPLDAAIGLAILLGVFTVIYGVVLAALAVTLRPSVGSAAVV